MEAPEDRFTVVLAAHLLAPADPVGRGSRRAVIKREVSAPQERRPTGEFETLHVNGMMPTAHRERLMRDFRAPCAAR